MLRTSDIWRASLFLSAGGSPSEQSSDQSSHVLWSFFPTKAVKLKLQWFTEWKARESCGKPSLDNYTIATSSLFQLKTKAPVSWPQRAWALQEWKVILSACTLLRWSSSMLYWWRGHRWHFVSLYTSHSCFLSTPLINLSLIFQPHEAGVTGRRVSQQEVKTILHPSTTAHIKIRHWNYVKIKDASHLENSVPHVIIPTCFCLYIHINLNQKTF